VIPLFTAITEFMPNMSEALDNANASKSLWQSYEETAEDKKIYTKNSRTLTQT